MEKRIIIIISAIILISGCYGAGTLGGFSVRYFPVSKRVLVQAIDSLYTNYPGYRIPDKWKEKDDWNVRGFDFLDSRLFYFKTDPEEMYYVSFYGDANRLVQADTAVTGISVRAVTNENVRWLKEENTSSADRDRIEIRFDEEIVNRLKQYTNHIVGKKN